MTSPKTYSQVLMLNMIVCFDQLKLSHTENEENVMLSLVQGFGKMQNLISVTARSPLL